MSLQARTILNLLAGALAGFLAWAIIDLTGWFTAVINYTHVIAVGSSLYWLQALIGGAFGVMVGILLGIVDALAFDSDEQRLRAVGLGALIGAAGGVVGIVLGQTLWALLAPANAGTSAVYAHPVAYMQEVVARSLSWALIGAGIGAAQGASRWSTRILTQGLFGGAAGGLLGGFAFEALQRMLGQPSLSRLIGFVLIGAFIGFFIGLIQNIFKQAWIRVVVGKNEGKEYLIARPVTTIGRSELADIGLFGDRAIAPTHCAIEIAGGRYRLRPLLLEEPSPSGQVFAPIMINGMEAADEVWLADGDTIHIATRTLQFRERATQVPSRAAEPSEQDKAPVMRPSVVPPDEPLRPLPSAAYKLSSRPALTPDEAGVVAKSTAPVQPSQLAGTRLVCLDGAYAGQSFALSNKPLTIGRASDREIALTKDEALSRLHATISFDNGRHRIKDEGSINGTYVNEVELIPHEGKVLRIGDFVRFGRTICRYE